MKSTLKQSQADVSWPPEVGSLISFAGASGPETAVLKQVRWGLVWRDFILQDGRVIPEHKVTGSPQPQVWRNVSDVSEDERHECEERLLSMANSGMDPHKRDQLFWAELNQYLAYTYLRYKQGTKPQNDEIHGGEMRPDNEVQDDRR